MAEREENISKISRREFLKDAGLVVGGATIGSMSMLNACKGGETTTITKTSTVTAPGNTSVSTVTVTSTPSEPSAANVVSLTVNGKKYDMQVNSNDTLQVVLREKLGFNSPKDMCFGWGACGSCSVILDGRPVLSCMAFAAELDGSVVETAEGIADSGHPIVKAFVDAYAIQCGYCTPGMVVTAKALLDRNSNPTEDDVRNALGGNLCRCGAYPRMFDAVSKAAQALANTPS